jgi:hypothetical protein
MKPISPYYRLVATCALAHPEVNLALLELLHVDGIHSLRVRGWVDGVADANRELTRPRSIPRLGSLAHCQHLLFHTNPKCQLKNLPRIIRNLGANLRAVLATYRNAERI